MMDTRHTATNYLGRQQGITHTACAVGGRRRARTTPYTKAQVACQCTCHRAKMPLPSAIYIGWDWMSWNEVEDAIVRVFRWPHVSVCRVPHMAAAPIQGLKDGFARIILCAHHYTVMSHVGHGIIFFDPLGNSHKMYFTPTGDRVDDLCIKVQPSNSTLCAVYCLLFLHICDSVGIGNTTGGSIRDIYLSLLTRFVAVAPELLAPNERIAELFAVDHRVGEEFSGGLPFTRFHHYDMFLRRRHST
uniref:LO8 n=1 Tax=Sand tiger adomavirus 1 TaxID=3238819 RepID=A0AB39ACP5_9VIRU